MNIRKIISLTNIRSFSKKPSSFDIFKTEVSVESPGRINLIGEHTDYNNGFVMPTAIDKKIYFKLRRNQTENFCRIYSETYKNGFELHLDKDFRKTSGWEDYIQGVIIELQNYGHRLEGFDCIIESKLPVGAGISSSAALECGLASGLNELFQLRLSALEIVKISQKAENNFVGSNCGIMDQFASVMSKKDHVSLLDCKDLNFEYLPLNFDDFSLLLLNTNVSHKLTDSAYNSRREECEAAVEIIRKDHPQVNSLRDVSFDLLEKYKSHFPDKMYQRCRYILQENERVLLAADSLKSGNLEKFGELMYQSHKGLQHNYEVSCPELDFLVEFSSNKNFIYGSRMMGGGFGGCTINLIKTEFTEDYIQKASSAYQEQFGIELDAISVLPGEGTKIVRNRNYDE